MLSFYRDALARLIALWCVTVSVASTNAQMELSTGSHIPYAASSAYLANTQSTAALDTKGVLHQGTEYSGVPPWLNDRVKSSAPEYPYSERLHRHEGQGIVRLTLDLKTGLVTKAAMVKSTGFSALDQSAVRAFKRWTWKPGRWKEIYIPVNFRIGSGPAPLPAGAARLPPSYR
jgi:TonB family protein